MRLSIVIPVKGNEGTIALTVNSLLGQDLDDDFEVIVVVDAMDRACEALGPLEHDGRLLVVHPRPFPIEGARDANWRRSIGLSHAKGDVLALTDADMVFGPCWAAQGLAIIDSGADCVGGVMRSAEGLGRWGKYIDRNPIGAKTPRFPDGLRLSQASLGARGHMPPITANLFFTRQVLEVVGPPRPDLTWNYEDYAFCEDIVAAGFTIITTPELVGEHYHRQGIRSLTKEYFNSGRGCRQFARAYPRSILARRRKRQLVAIGLLAIALPTLLALAPLPTLAISATALMGLSLLTCVQLRDMGAAWYPLATALLGTAFAIGYANERLFGKPLNINLLDAAMPDEPIDHSSEESRGLCERTELDLPGIEAAERGAPARYLVGIPDRVTVAGRRTQRTL